MQYDDIIKKLKENVPVSNKPELLIASIMNSMNSFHDKSILTAHQLKHKVISIMRMVSSAAAIFLIIFFITEQHDTNNKLSRLERNIRQVKYSELLTNYSNARYTEINEVFPNSAGVDSMNETLVINRQTLNYLLSRIKQLETENLDIQQKLNKLYNDTLTVQTQTP